MGLFNEKGLLDPGFHEYKFDEIDKIFVKDFSESQTREQIYKGFLMWTKELLNICMPNEIWIDGSFVTSKINPNDIDLVCFIEAIDYIQNKAKIDQLRMSGKQNYCDTYIAISPNPILPASENQNLINNRNYWRGQFGFDREDNPKGMIKITKQSLIIFLKEGIKDV